MKKNLIIVVLFLLPSSMKAQDTLTVLHLNDTHSTLAPVGPRSDNLSGTQGGIARAVTFIGITKLSDPNVLTLHAGDFSIGDLFYNKFFGVPELQILKSVGLDAMTVGNHEWDLTPSTFLGTLQAAFPNPSDAFPFLSANTDLSDPSLTELKDYIFPYTIKQVGNIKAGIFGMTTPSANLFSQPAPAIVSEDVINIAVNMITTLSSEGCDIIIFLSHLGLYLDKQIAENIPGINIIVSGHDHYLLEKPLEIINPSGEKTWIVQANSNYLNIGKLTLEINNKNISIIDYQSIPLDESIPEEPTTKAVVNNLISEIESFYGIPFYTAQAGNAFSFFKESETDLLKLGYHDTPAGNLCADAFKWKTGTDIAVQPGGSTALPSYQGAFVPADLFRITGYGFNTVNTLGFQLVTFNITGAGLYAGLEFGLSEIEINDEYLLQVSGLEYTYDSNLPAGSRVTSAKINGNTLDPNAVYSVTSNELLKSFLDYLQIPYYDLEVLEGITEFQALMEYVTETGPVIYPKSIGRIANINSSAGKEMINGGGWLNAPHGSLIKNPGSEGKMIFTLTANQNHKGLDGKFIFTLPGKFILFISNKIDWIVTNDSTAQIKGSGKINSKGDYGFLISAVSNSKKLLNGKDKIHIKIWKKSNEELIFDSFSEQPVFGNISIVSNILHEEDIIQNANPDEFDLAQNYPNPFNPSTKFKFQIPETEFVTLKIFDILGNEVATVVSEQLIPGNYSYQWNASEFASGVYIYCLRAGRFIETKKLILMK